VHGARANGSASHRQPSTSSECTSKSLRWSIQHALRRVLRGSLCGRCAGRAAVGGAGVACEAVGTKALPGRPSFGGRRTTERRHRLSSVCSARGQRLWLASSIAVKVRLCIADVEPSFISRPATPACPTPHCTRRATASFARFRPRVNATLGGMRSTEHFVSLVSRRHACLVVGALLTVRRSVAAREAVTHPQRKWYEAAESMRKLAISWGDQPYGAVLVTSGGLVVEGPSRVVKNSDPNAHAEREAIREAQRLLGTLDLRGSVLYSTSRPCKLCEEAAAKANVGRMYFGSQLVDAGAPRQ